MANPQKENGYTAIANETLEALARIRIPGEARQMLDVIIRKTYGYNKKADKISTSQFMELTGLPRGKIYKTRLKLKAMNLITVSQKGDSQILIYSIQKDYDKWRPSPKKDTVSQKGDRCLPIGVKTVSHIVVHNIHKDNIQKKETNSLSYIQKIIEVYKQLKGYATQPDWDKHHYKRHVAPAKKLYEVAPADWLAAMEWVSKQNYCDWTLETVAKKYPDFKKQSVSSVAGAAGRILND
jgi:phage replication O-like protein O